MTVPAESPDSSWLLHAACRGTNTEVFFPSRGENKALARAKAICRDCPVRPQCLDQALTDGEKHGVFGGLSERQRRTIRRTNTAAQRQQEMHPSP